MLIQELKKDAFREAYLRCSNAIEDMEKELKVACHAPHGNIDGVLKVSFIHDTTIEI